MPAFRVTSTSMPVSMGLFMLAPSFLIPQVLILLQNPLQMQSPLSCVPCQRIFRFSFRLTAGLSTSSKQYAF